MTSVTFHSPQPSAAEPGPDPRPDSGTGPARTAALRITRGEPTEEQLAAVTAALLAVCAHRRRPEPARAAAAHGHQRARWSQEAAPRGAGSWRLPDPPC